METTYILTERSNEILEKANELYPETVGHDCWGHIETDVDPRNRGFIKGAAWADEHPKSPWIKCSERMPPFTDGAEYPWFDTKLKKEVAWKWESSDRVLVMCSDGGCNINYYKHDVYIDGDKLVKEEYGWITKLNVVAWMPIPEFKEE